MKVFASILVAVSMALLCTVNFSSEVSILVEVLFYAILLIMLAVGGYILRKYYDEN